MKRILIVEPDTKYRGRARGALEHLQCDVVALESAEEALQIGLDAGLTRLEGAVAEILESERAG